MAFQLIATQLHQQTRKRLVSSVLPCERSIQFRFKSTTNNANNASAAEVTASSSTSSTAASSEAQEGGVPIGRCLIAMVAGVTTVSLGAAVVETGTSSSVPPFDPSKQRFDQSTFIGRFSKMLLGCDPKLLLYSHSQVQHHQNQILNYQDILDAASSSQQDMQSVHRSLWESQRIATAAIHPDTDQTIPHPFRMSGYVPFNGPICVAMVASTSTPALLFWSWVNQSQNALINYFNRNASTEMDSATILKSYATAVGAALSVAFGLATFIQKKYDPARARQMLRWVAFPSSVAASSLNCYIVRSPEILTGVKLVNDVGQDVLPGETSCEAAKRGVHSTTASRALLQAPVYFFPPVLLSTVPMFKNLLLRNPMASVPLTTYLVLVSFGLGLPATVAIFPQMSELKMEDAEEKFQGLLDKRTGKPYEVFYYNKGL